MVATDVDLTSGAFRRSSALPTARSPLGSFASNLTQSFLLARSAPSSVVLATPVSVESAVARCTKSVWIHSNTAVSVVNQRWAVVLNLWGSVLVISILVCCTKDNGRTAVVPPLYIIHDPRVCPWPRRRL